MDEASKLSRSLLKSIFKEYLDEQADPIKACDCEELKSSFLLRNNPTSFYNQMQQFIDKAIDLGIIKDTNDDDIELRYRLSENPSDFLILFKYIKE